VALTLEFELRVVHSILIDVLEVARELLIFPEMLLQPQQLVEDDLHGQ
jgi:hypothetical protein